MKTVSYILFLLFSLVNPVVSQAVSWKWYFDLGLMNGGDTIAEIPVQTCYDWGCSTSYDGIKAGGAATLNFGGVIKLTPFLNIRITAGMDRDSVTAGGDAVFFERFHEDIGLEFVSGVHQVAAGVTSYHDIVLDLSDIGSGIFEFDDTEGTYIEYKYKLFAIRQGTVKYRQPLLGEYDGNYTALIMAIKW